MTRRLARALAGALPALVLLAEPAAAQRRPQRPPPARDTAVAAPVARPLPPSVVADLRPIRLDAAIEQAQRNAPAAIAARGQVRAAGSGVRLAYGNFLPNLNFNLGLNRSQGDRQDISGRLVPYTAPTTYSNGFSSQVVLFDGGRSFSELSRARADVGTAEANETAQQFNVALQVKQQYYTILAAREQESASRAQLEAAEAQLAAASARVRAGAATLSDSLRSVILVGNARLQLLTAQNSLRNASAALTRLVASPVSVTADPRDTLDLPIAPLDSAELLRLAEEGPAVRQAQAQLHSANAAVRSARSPYLPSLNLNVSRNGSGFDKQYGLGAGQLAYSNTVSLGLQYQIFNRFGREDAIVRARVAEENAEAQLRDARFLAQQNLVQQIAVLRTAEERISIQQATVAAAVEDLRVQQQRYQLGASTLLELLNSQTALDNARAALIQARQDYRVARAQIEAVIGRDLR